MPLKGGCYLLLSGPQFRIEAEAGLPKRPSGNGIPDAGAAAGSRRDPLLRLPRVAADIGFRGQALPCDRRWSPVPETRKAHSRYSTVSREFWTTRLGKQSRAYADLPAWPSNMVSCMRRSSIDRNSTALTGLPNRLLLEDQLRQAMVIARRQGTLLGVCCIDLDHFKQINDDLGHKLGDAFLKLVGERLRLSIREQ